MSESEANQPLYLPEGFEFAGIAAGIKEDVTKKDLSLITCPRGATAAGVYTQNLFFAAPVRWDRERTPRSDVRAVVVNSGNANACTGQQGWQDTVQMAQWTAAACGAEPDQVLVMSTGIIGQFLPMPAIDQGIRTAVGQLGATLSDFQAAADGILTTDRSRKVSSRSVKLANGTTVNVAAMAKGAGMIGPNMATMLATVLTDATLSTAASEMLLKSAVEPSFNSISVEGHTSTNDTVLLLASGAKGNSALEGEDLDRLSAAVADVCIELAKMIPDDGEGASHLIEINIAGCRTEQDADRIARTIADSALVKTAVTGGDPNWGRIMSAAGYSGVDFAVEKSNLWINQTQIFANGAPVPFDDAALSQSMKSNRETILQIQLGEGEAEKRFWTSDLTVDYVKFNADYRT
jgi:glutamate N-acetyltransferase/amino-acid N-acetyltransferase